MVTSSVPHPDVDDTGPHRLVDEYNSNYVLVLKLAKARAEAIKIQRAISSRSGACQLNMSPASGFDYPHSRIESRESVSSAGSCKGKQRQMCAICKRFFLTAEEVGSWVKCPTLMSHCLASATTVVVVRLVGAFEVVAVWLSINNRTMVTKDLALGANYFANLRSSYRIQNLARGTTSPRGSWKREDTCVQRGCGSVSGKCDRECDCIQFLFCTLGGGIQSPSHRIDFGTRKSRRIEIWLRGLAGDLFSRCSSFPYFF